MTALGIKRVLGINVLIHVQERVVQTLTVQWSITFPCALVLKDLLEMLLSHAQEYLVSYIEYLNEIPILIIKYFSNGTTKSMQPITVWP